MSESESPVTNGHGRDGGQGNSRRSRSQSRSINGDLSEDDADLFGDEDDAPTRPLNESARKLDDSELDSGDDDGRNDRLEPTIEEDLENEDIEEVQENLIGAEIPRVRAPEADELFLLNMPPFLGLKQKKFDPATYEIPTHSHEATESTDDPTFSPFNTASTSLFWRRDPRNPKILQSNSRIIRWSDGSLTLQIASSPKDQYRISSTALRQSFGKKQQKGTPHNDYDPSKDAQVYLAAPHLRESLLQIVAPLDAALRILPTGDQADESVLKLQQSLAAATNQHDPLSQLKHIKEDPEMAKKAAELFEKDRMRTTRRRELAEEKLLTRKDRVLGRSGLGRSAGLSVAGLEDEDGMPTARGKKKSAKRKINRRGEIYSDDEDEDYPRGRTREDEYDLDDGFMAASDEEPEIYDESGGAEEEDPDVDDLEIEGRDTVIQGKTRGGQRDRVRERSRTGTPKRSFAAVDEEAGGLAGSPQARKVRRVIDDDDDDE